MRVGQNPAKSLDKAAHPAPLTVVLVTYIPHNRGYYKESLEVFQACLDSLWEHTAGMSFDVLVFDNASGPETRAFLAQAHREGRIQYLMFSRQNLGVVGAWNMAFPAAPGEIVAYADSDVYFRPGWLEASLRILEAFPRVGMVTARPFPNAAERWTATRAWAEQEPEAETAWGRFLAWEDFRAFERSLGHPEDRIRQAYENLRLLKIRYRGVEAIAGAGHWQFVAPKAALLDVLPLPYDRPMGADVTRLDLALNEKGYLRLMTPEPYVDHMGNRLPDFLRGKEGTTTAPATRGQPGLLRRLAHLGPVRKVLLALYDRIFRLYYE